MKLFKETSAVKNPIKNCYWVIPGKLLAGEYPRDKDRETSQDKINDLLQAGVTTFIDLTEAGEGLKSYSELIGTTSHCRFSIRDVSVPNSREQTIEILAMIHQSIDTGEVIYVHCWGGIGRTGVIIGCWLADNGYPGEAALIRLRELWQHCPKSILRRSPETKEQEEYIINWSRCKK